MQKRIMMLGGNLVQCTAIKAAKALGYYVITVDYLPENPGHPASGHPGRRTDAPVSVYHY